MAKPSIKRGSLNNLSQNSLGSLGIGAHPDGGGLYLRVMASGARRWIFVWVRDGARSEFGIGLYPAISLAKARVAAGECREQLASGNDPREVRKQKRAALAPLTFRDVMDEYLTGKVAALRNPKHRAQWRTTLETYAAKLLPMPVKAIRTEHVLSVLKAIWTEKPETASRVRGRIESILNAAKAKGHRDGENPAAWRGHLSNLLPARNKRLSVKHFAARPWRDMPALMRALESSDSISARCLRFVILTACRSGEGRGARWNEFDLEAGIWTIPAARTKTATEHRVPLPSSALDILNGLKPLARGADSLAFPGGRGVNVLSDVALTKALRRIDPTATVHGMRSSFRDWAGEATHFPRELAEQALAHVIGNEAERAYRRGDALEKRRALMDAWSDFLAQRPAENIVPIRRTQ